MRRRRQGGVYGPYKEHDRKGQPYWRVTVRAPSGEKASETFKIEAQAERFAADVRAELEDRALDVAEAMELYADYQRGKGNRPDSVKATAYALGRLFPDTSLALEDLTPKRAQLLYDRLTTQCKAASHHLSLREAKALSRFCVKRGLLAANPFADVEKVGRANRGKGQLRTDEARKLLEVCADHGKGGTAVKVALLLGLRSGEIVGLAGRDVDDDGQILHVAGDGEGKTENATRHQYIPETLRDELLELKASAGNGPLFGWKDRSRPRYWTKKLCKLAGVPVITAHGLRGTHVTVAATVGTTGEVVAAAVGHGSEAVTRSHYAQAGSFDQGQAERVKLRLVK